MKTSVDMHMHSIYSLDGEFDIPTLAKLIQEKEMKTVSLTDHNSVKGVQELKASLPSVNVISGIELDVEHKGVGFHLLAYGIDETSPVWLEVEMNIINGLKHSTQTATKQFLDHYNIQIDKDKLKSIEKHGIIVPEDLGELLLNDEAYDTLPLLVPYRKGNERSDNPYVNFYWDHFSKGTVGYYKEKLPDAIEKINLIHKQGGKAVIAHPHNNFKNNMDVFMDLLPLVDGVEVYSSYHSQEIVNQFEKICEDHGKWMTCGSDYHGKNKPAIQIGTFSFNVKEDIVKQGLIK